MTLTTHAVVGASLITLFPNPAVGLPLAFVSHFLLDAIPHWDYSLESSNEDADFKKKTLIFTKKTWFDLVKIGTDGLLGLFLTLFLFGGYSKISILLLCLGAFFGMFPDGLQFLYYRFGGSFLTRLQRFHVGIHAKKKLDTRPVLGITLQIIVIALFFTLARGGV